VAHRDAVSGRSSHQSMGLFEKPNAGFEGLCMMDEGRLLIPVEREPRGYALLNLANETSELFIYNKSELTYKRDLCTTHGTC
jgi:uncharacterized protein YjiK